MESDGSPETPWIDDDSKTSTPILVGEGPVAPPFMQGFLVSSLVRRGVPFATAYSVARVVERAFRDRGADRISPEDITRESARALEDDPSRRKMASPQNRIRGSAVDEILVVGPGGSLPFSTGILSQSFLVTALDPRGAFEIARRIQQELREQRLRQIDRPALRALAHRELERSAGPEAAERYLVWRRYEEPEQPVILLLGGTSGVGKTTLALEVARRMGIGRVLSTDSIRQIMRLMISADLMPWLHASSYDAHFLLGPVEGRPARVLDGFRAQASSVAVGVHASLDRSVEESANLVVDGVSLIPGLVDVDRYAGRAKVVSCVVATLDEAALKDRFRARASGQPNRLAARYLENLDGILEIQRHLIGEATRRNILVVDNLDLDGSAQAIIGHVLDTLRGA